MPVLNRLPLLRITTTTTTTTTRLSSPAVVVVPIRSLQSSTRLWALKESRDKEGIEKDIEHHKQDQLKKQQEGKGHWKEELASESESSVKADRGDLNSSPENIKKLQEETAGKVNSGDVA